MRTLCIIYVKWILLFIMFSHGNSFSCGNLISLEVHRQFDILIYCNNDWSPYQHDVSSTKGILNNISDLWESRKVNQRYSETVIVLRLDADNVTSVFSKILSASNNPNIYYVIIVPHVIASDLENLVKLKDPWIKETMPNTFILDLNDTFWSDDGWNSRSIRVWRILVIENSIVKLVDMMVTMPLNADIIRSLVVIPGGLQNMSIKALGLPLESSNPYELTTTTVDGKFKFVAGLDLEIIEYLKDALNFSVIPVRGTGYIRLAGNGSLLGMGAQLQSGDADVVIYNSEYIPYRQERLSYLVPTYVNYISAFLISKSSTDARDIFFRCFEFRLWLSLLLVWIVSFLVTHGFLWFKRLYATMPNEDSSIRNQVGIITTGAACQQGWYTFPDSTSMRLVITVNQVTCLICFAAFTATLVSILSVEQKLINVASDLTKFQYRIYGDNNTFEAEYFINKLEGKIDVRIEDRASSFVTSVDNMYTGKAAVISVSDVFYPNIIRNYFNAAVNGSNESQVERKLCRDIQKVHVSRVQLKAGMVVRKNSPLKPYFDRKITMMIERGIKQRFLTTYFKCVEIQCTKNSGNGQRAIENRDVSTAFVILLTGFVACLCLITMEKITSKLRSR